ncbi:hypothetical protein [Enhygromyxa salina]|uniref:Uncharacterized protein n=1 Tax=Enhygromyxa salina TaxID=215803 RepID=A0A2S9XU57_9BACT|nr:hypothetical protein [Enhygromyxa salina]PRP96408.1 hypothetical protein ENSA7_72230 [Enhygromyxa salina]
MTDITEYLEAVAQGRAVPNDWSRPQWAVSYPIFAWLGLAPPLPSPRPQGTVISDSDLEALCAHMLQRFVDKSNCLVWSSYLLGTAVEAVAAVVQGPPEPLVQSVWDFLKNLELTETVYQFCRSFGREVLVRFRGDPKWKLEWTQGIATDSQSALRYWVLAVKPEIWTGAVETATIKSLRSHSFSKL